jgi:hypothetical protein
MRIAPTMALSALVLAGCSSYNFKRKASMDASPSFVTSPRWHTLTSQHRVNVTVRLQGKTEKRTLRGLVAVERPGNLRLRALGPAGITLFDLLVRNGEPKVVSAIRDSAGLDDAIRSLAADLAAAYTLDPQGDRTVVQGDAHTIIVREPGRRVSLFDFVGDPAMWRRAEIETDRYHVSVEVEDDKVDATLDPSMFTD